MIHPNRDQVIAGGGLAGLVQAVLFRTRDQSVTILEQGDGTSLLQDPRSLALSYSTRCILQTARIWDHLEAHACPITHVEVSQRHAFGTTRLSAEEEHLSALGYVVAAAQLGKVLRDALRADPECDYRTHAAVEGVAVHPEGLQLLVRHENASEEYCARLLVIADGVDSVLRQALGLETGEVDYDQSVLVSQIEVDAACEGWAYERFTDSGPLALLPQKGGSHALVWALTRAGHEQALQWDDQHFREQLQSMLGSRVGTVRAVGPRHGFDLKFQRAGSRISSRSVLIGNAAYTFHPVAAQGFNLVVRDAAWLAECLQGATDPGEEVLLTDYARGRDIDARRVAGFTDLLAQGFVWRNPAVQCLRGAALLALDCLPGLRTRFVRFGMGADLPQSELVRRPDERPLPHA